MEIDDNVIARVTIDDIGRRKWRATELEAEEQIWVVTVGDLRRRVRLLDGEWAGRTAIAGFEGPKWSDGRVGQAWFRLKRVASWRKYPLLSGRTAFGTD